MTDQRAVDASVRLCLDVKAAARALGVSSAVVRDWVARGVLARVSFPSTRRPGESSRRVLIAVADLEDFVRKHRETAGD